VAPPYVSSVPGPNIFSISPISSCKATAAPSCYPWDRKVAGGENHVDLESPAISYFYSVLASLCMLPERRDPQRKGSIETMAQKTASFTLPNVGSDFFRNVSGSSPQPRNLDTAIFCAVVEVFDLDRARRALAYSTNTAQQLFSKCPVSFFAVSAMPLISAFPTYTNLLINQTSDTQQIPQFQIRQYTLRFCMEVLQAKPELFQSPERPAEVYLQLLFSRAFFFMHEQQHKPAASSTSPSTSPRKSESSSPVEPEQQEIRCVSLNRLICRVLQPMITASVCRLALIDPSGIEIVLPYLAVSLLRVEQNAEKLASQVDSFVGADLASSQQSKGSIETSGSLELRQIRALLCCCELSRLDRVGTSLCRSMFFLLSNKKTTASSLFAMALLKCSVPLCRLLLLSASKLPFSSVTCSEDTAIDFSSARARLSLHSSDPTIQAESCSIFVTARWSAVSLLDLYLSSNRFTII
jgi:hypothetical protein